MALPYASCQSLEVHYFPLTLGIDAFHDIQVTNIPSVPNGVYRLITRTFLRWLKIRVDLANSPTSTVPQADRDAAADFFKRCCEASGLTPSERSLPSGYSRPTLQSAWHYDASWCVWDATTPKETVIMSRTKKITYEEDQMELAIPDGIGDSPQTSDSDGREVLVRCPSLFPMVRGPNLKARYFRRDQIPYEATEYRGMADYWFPIRDHWKLPPNAKSQGDAGIWTAPQSPSKTPEPVASAKNPLEDLL